MTLTMNSQKLAFGHLRSIEIPEHIGQAGRHELILDRRKTPGVLRVTLTGIVFVAFGVADIGSGQGGIPVLQGRYAPV